MGLSILPQGEPAEHHEVRLAAANHAGGGLIGDDFLREGHAAGHPTDEGVVEVYDRRDPGEHAQEVIADVKR